MISPSTTMLASAAARRIAGTNLSPLRLDPMLERPSPSNLFWPSGMACIEEQREIKYSISRLQIGDRGHRSAQDEQLPSYKPEPSKEAQRLQEGNQIDKQGGTPEQADLDDEDAEAENRRLKQQIAARSREISKLFTQLKSAGIEPHIATSRRKMKKKQQ